MIDSQVCLISHPLCSGLVATSRNAVGSIFANRLVPERMRVQWMFPTHSPHCRMRPHVTHSQSSLKPRLIETAGLICNTVSLDCLSQLSSWIPSQTHRYKFYSPDDLHTLVGHLQNQHHHIVSNCQIRRIFCVHHRDRGVTLWNGPDLGTAASAEPDCGASRARVGTADVPMRPWKPLGHFTFRSSRLAAAIYICASRMAAHSPRVVVG
jgi:hypothetical protein